MVKSTLPDQYKKIIKVGNNYKYSFPYGFCDFKMLNGLMPLRDIQNTIYNDEVQTMCTLKA